MGPGYLGGWRANDTCDWNGLRIHADVGAAGRRQRGGTQEFIKIHDPRVTPEPVTVALLATGVVGVLGMVDRGVRV